MSIITVDEDSNLVAFVRRVCEIIELNQAEEDCVPFLAILKSQESDEVVALQFYNLFVEFTNSIAKYAKYNYFWAILQHNFNIEIEAISKAVM